MSEEKERTDQAQQQEPSMEDILASIRRILSEDGEEGEPGSKDAQPPEADDEQAVSDTEAEAPAPEPEQALSEPEPEPAEEPEIQPEPEPVPEPEPMPETEPEPEPELVMEPELPQEPEPAFEERYSEPAPAESGEGVLELTEAMRIPEGQYDLVSHPTAQVSTDVLADLARAILDRRELSVGAAGITLESMVRGMLRPLLKEWLDRNLPYLIERLVKREIDLMVNRAEKLED